MEVLKAFRLRQAEIIDNSINKVNLDMSFRSDREMSNWTSMPESFVLIGL